MTSVIWTEEMRVIPRLAQHAEGPRKRSTATANGQAPSVRVRLVFGGSKTCNCEGRRRANASLGMTTLFSVRREPGN
jgi:hypothetical protein